MVQAFFIDKRGILRYSFKLGSLTIWMKRSDMNVVDMADTGCSTRIADHKWFVVGNPVAAP
jgi:hypothetical protein